MPEEALSPGPPPAARRRGGRAVVVALLVLGALYLLVTAGIRWYVSDRIEGVVGEPVPGFALDDLQGRRWTAADLRGKTTVLNFCRSRCASCLRERDAIHALATEADPARVQVLSVMMDAVQGFAPQTTRDTLERFAYRHPVLMADAAFADAFHGAGWSHVTPVTYIVDANGRITAAYRGHQTLETLRAATR